MNLIQIIRESVNTRYLVTINNGLYELIEESNNSKCKNVKLKPIKYHCVLSLDKYSQNYHPIRLFKDNPPHKGLKKICDYSCFILDVQKQKIYIFLIDLKSSNIKPAQKQFQSCKNLIKYLLNQINTFINADLESFEIVFIGIVFHSKSTKKTTTKKCTRLLKQSNSNENDFYAIINCNETHILSKLIHEYQSCQN